MRLKVWLEVDWNCLFELRSCKLSLDVDAPITSLKNCLFRLRQRACWKKCRLKLWCNIVSVELHHEVFELNVRRLEFLWNITSFGARMWSRFLGDWGTTLNYHLCCSYHDLLILHSTSIFKITTVSLPDWFDWHFKSLIKTDIYFISFSPFHALNSISII